MARVLRYPTDPEAVGLAILALRNYVTPVTRPTKFEKETASELTKLKVSKRTARRMVANFDSIRPSVRERYLGSIGTATRMPRRTVATRDANAITTSHVVIPQMTLRYRYPGRPGQALPPGPAVLAPIDYTVVYRGMHCIDETHWDSWGSDEIYIVTSAVSITPAGQNLVRTERHPITNGQSGEYGSVDSHDTRIGPVAACWNQPVANTQLGMSLTTVVFEHDKGDPDAYRDEVDDAVKLAIAIATYLFPAAGPIRTHRCERVCHGLLQLAPRHRRRRDRNSDPCSRS